MGWNGQNNNNDPWQRNRSGGNNNGNNGDDPLGNLLKTILGKNGQNKAIGLVVIAIIVLCIIIFSGFYTVREAEQGVVLRFGQFERIEQPGLHWRVPLVESVTNIDSQIVLSTKSSGSMLTEDENVVNVEMEVQYRITDPKAYLYNAEDPDSSLSQATDSALRYVIGHTKMDDVLTNGREQVRQATRELLRNIIEPYNMGLSLVDVNFLPARAPDEVKAAFDDAIAAQEDEQRFKREAEAYKNEVIPKAEGNAKRITEEAQAYSRGVVAKAEGEIARFEKILPEYIASPEITKKRIYIETMEAVYSKSGKVILNVENNKGNSLLYLPLDKLVQPKDANSSKGSK